MATAWAFIKGEDKKEVGIEARSYAPLLASFCSIVDTSRTATGGSQRAGFEEAKTTASRPSTACAYRGLRRTGGCRPIICEHRSPNAARPGPCATRDRSQRSGSRHRWWMRSASCAHRRTPDTIRGSSERHHRDAATGPRGTPWIVCEAANIPELSVDGEWFVRGNLTAVVRLCGGPRQVGCPFQCSR